MQAGEPRIAHLALARAQLLEPFGLDEDALLRVLGEIFIHKADYADLYFQATRSEGWSLEEGIVKSGSFNIDQGVGVRAVSGEKTAFAYSDDISFDALAAAAQAHTDEMAARDRLYHDPKPEPLDNEIVAQGNDGTADEPIDLWRTFGVEERRGFGGVIRAGRCAATGSAAARRVWRAWGRCRRA